MCEECGCHHGDSIKGLAHIEIFCKDIEASKRFYTETLGFTVDYETELKGDGGNIKVAFLKLADLTIVFAQFPKGNPEKEMGPVNHFALEVSNVDAIFNHLRAHGVETESPEVAQYPLKNGLRCFNLRGPDGERIELAESL